MSDAATPSWMIDRLRANLSAAEIPLAARDLDRILDLGLLKTALAFDALDRSFTGDGLPDHLGGVAGTPPPGGPASGRAQAPADA
ncbi:MAG: hypothetical protein ACRENJ_10970, partial [Candidatus Eiseniibacteriota bacterium]